MKISKKPTNPCIMLCKYDNRDICTGCYRTKKEVSNWPNYTEEEKKLIYDKIVMRGGNPYKKKRYLN